MKSVYRVRQEGYIQFKDTFVAAVQDATQVAKQYERTTHIEKYDVCGESVDGCRILGEVYHILTLDSYGVPYGQS